MKPDYKADVARLEARLDRMQISQAAAIDMVTLNETISRRRAINDFLELAMKEMAGKVEFTRWDLYEWVDKYRAANPIMGEPGYVESKSS